MNKICHISSLHPRDDTRIFQKECKSLSSYFRVYFYVADGLGDEEIDNVKIIDCGKRKNGIFKRTFLTSLKIVIKVLKEKFSIIHIHDPEFIIFKPLFALCFKSTFIFDIHENVGKSILNKNYIKHKKIVKLLYNFIEYIFINNSYKILAEDSYFEEKIYKKKSIIVKNFPIFDDFSNYYVSQRDDFIDLFYLGSITFERGLFEMCMILSKINNKNTRLHLVGPVHDSVKEELYKRINNEHLLKRIIFYGRKSIFEGYEISKQCRFGFALIHPIANYISSYPTKIFEYSACNLPFFVSNFELNKKVVNNINFGYLVNPLDIDTIVKIINKSNVTKFESVDLDRLAEEYSWESEFSKLISLYRKIEN